MSTINISLPIKLKSEASLLVKNGYYSSFSDLVRDSLRRLLENSKYNLWAYEAKKEMEKGKAVVLNSDKDIDSYFKDL